ncbi:MAG TPA: hypothetical protein V6D20_05330 [Candidatus Obscuribacterales bacterium]
MALPLVPIFTGLFSLAKGWMEGKQKKQEAIQKKEMEIIENSASWDEIHAKGAAKSWKDEYLMIVLSIPVIMCFIPGLDQYVTAGFAALQDTPEWYQLAFGLTVAASFGYRKFIDIMQKTKKGK